MCRLSDSRAYVEKDPIGNETVPPFDQGNFDEKQRKNNAGYKKSPLPINPLVCVALIPILPKGLYLNRGFTIWFHIMSAMYALTRSRFLCRFQAFIGTSICLGWYASIILDFVVADRPVFRLLYKNMPEVLSKVIVLESGALNYTPLAIFAMAVSHVGDFLGHPVLTYFFWRKHKQLGGSVADLCSWETIGCAYIFSRFWSFVHNFYNFRTFHPFYMGFDVYEIDDVTQWYPAYVSEGTVFVIAILYKLYVMRCEYGSPPRKHQTPSAVTDDQTGAPPTRSRYEDRPKLLLLSESSISEG